MLAVVETSHSNHFGPYRSMMIIPMGAVTKILKIDVVMMRLDISA